MKTLFCSVLVCLLGLSAAADKQSAPRVQVYSRTPGVFGKANSLICHVSGFHPPEIAVELLGGQRPLADAKQTDLAFEENWHYHLTKHAPFTPQQGEEFACRVTHMGKTSTFVWEPDM